MEIKRANLFLTLLAIPLLLSCADDLKGEKGDIGADGSALLAVFYNRPQFYPVFTGNVGEYKVSRIEVLATDALPARIVVGDVIYTNTANVEMDITARGLGGADTGPIEISSIYYLYGVPNETNNGFGLISSLRSPNNGPAGIEEWSYLGAFGTNTVGEIKPFSKEGTHFLFSDGRGILFAQAPETDVADPTPFATKKPITTEIARLLIHIDMNTYDAMDAQAEFTLSSGESVTDMIQTVAINGGGVQGDHMYRLTVPITDSEGRIWFDWGGQNAGWEALLHLAGWQEDPTAYK